MLRTTRLRCVMVVWHGRARRARCGDVDYESVFTGKWLSQLRCGIALDVSRIAVIGRALRRISKQDKIRFVEKISDKVDKASPL